MQTKPKVLFIDTAHSILTERLEQMGYQCDYFSDYKKADYQRIIENYEGVVIRSKIPLDETILPLATKLRWIARVGAGMENIDTALAEKLGITCLNAPEGNRDAVGEHALAMLLALMNRLLIADREVRNGIWIRAENRGFEIKGKTVGIIGYGNTGSVFARKLSGFECRILAYDKYKTGISNAYVAESDMETIFREADILSLHVPLTDETQFMVDEKYLEQFRKPIFLVNTSRGQVVKTADLVRKIESGAVRGACLDVLEFEKFSFEAIRNDELPDAFRKLIHLDQVILSPHIAGWTHESNLKMANVIADKVAALKDTKHTKS